MPDFTRCLRAAGATGLVALAVGLTGCMSIKSETATQRAPGVVTLGAVICASDYDATRSPDCEETNVAETDNLRLDAEGTGFGQLLVGLRVPDGSGAPQSFFSDNTDVVFSQSDSYTAVLEHLSPAVPGQHWVGYVSTGKSFNVTTAADRQTAFHPEFTVPAQADGSPFAEPFRWRLAIGFRQLADVSHAGDPIDCDASFTFCLDTPSEAKLASDLQAPVSDVGVLPAATVTAPQTTTATLQFPVRYLDAGGLGAQDLSVTATTDVPGAGAVPDVTNLHLAPNATSTVMVRVPVPVTAAPGSYAVTLTATSAAVTRTGRATLVVAPAPDSDGDGIADPADRCPSVPRGRFDRDGDGCVGPYTRIAARVTFSGEVDDRGFTIGTMRVVDLPARATVKLRCDVCHVRQTLTAKRSTLDLKRLRGKRLRRRTGVTVTVTKLGSIGKTIRQTLKPYGHRPSDFRRAARRPFATRRRCIPVGAARPAARCNARPPRGP